MIARAPLSASIKRQKRQLWHVRLDGGYKEQTRSAPEVQKLASIRTPP